MCSFVNIYLHTKLWKSNDIRVVNNDAVFYQSKTPEKCLKTAERENKKK